MTCIICKFPMVLDDVAVRNHHQQCVCLHCYDRQVGREVHMSKQLQRELDWLLLNIGVG